MQAAMIDNDMRENEYYYKQNYSRIDSTVNTGDTNTDGGVSLKESVYSEAGEDVLSDISPINNPLANPQERAAFQEMVSAQINTEYSNEGSDTYYDEGTAASDFVMEGYSDEAVQQTEIAEEYTPIMLGSGEGEVVLPGIGSDEEGYQPVMLGSGEGEVVLLGIGSDEEGYQPVMLGSGEGEVVLPGIGSDEEGYQPVMLGSGENEAVLPGSTSDKEGYQPVMLGSGKNEAVLSGSDSKENNYSPRILGSGNNEKNVKISKNDKNDDVVHLKLRHRPHEAVRKNTAKTAKSAEAENRPVGVRHHKIHRAVKSHKKLSLDPAVHSSVKSLTAQIESSIKESMKNNRVNSREMQDIINKNNDNIAEKAAQNAKNRNDNPSKNDYTPKHKDNDLTCQCPMCKNRRFVDRSNDIGVSFSSPQKISGAGSVLTVRSHEGEHVASEYRKAFQEGKTVVRQSVTIFMRNCPQCGTRYAAGGVTRTVTKMRADIAYKKAMEEVQNRRKNAEM